MWSKDILLMIPRKLNYSQKNTENRISDFSNYSWTIHFELHQAALLQQYISWHAAAAVAVTHQRPDGTNLEGILLALWDKHPIAGCQLDTIVNDRSAGYEPDTVTLVVTMFGGLSVRLCDRYEEL